MSERAIHVFNVVLLILLMGFSMYTLPLLPDQIPVRFDATGYPTNLALTTTRGWLALPTIGAALVALLYGCATLIGRNIKAINLPDRARFDALDPEQQQQVVAVTQRGLYWLAGALLLLFAAIQVGSYDVAVGRTERLPAYTLLTMGGVILFSLGMGPYLLWRTQALIQQLPEHRKQ